MNIICQYNKTFTYVSLQSKPQVIHRQTSSLYSTIIEELNTTESKDEDSKKIKGLLLSFEITITGPFEPLISIEESEENHWSTTKYWQTFGLEVMVFNATFNNLSDISWRPVLLVEEIGVPCENHRPAVSHWQTLSHNVVLSKPRHEQDSNS